MYVDDTEADSAKQITPRCLKLLATMLQNMFPSLNVHNVKLKQVGTIFGKILYAPYLLE